MFCIAPSNVIRVLRCTVFYSVRCKNKAIDFSNITEIHFRSLLKSFSKKYFLVVKCVNFLPRKCKNKNKLKFEFENCNGKDNNE